MAHRVSYMVMAETIGAQSTDSSQPSRPRGPLPNQWAVQRAVLSSEEFAASLGGQSKGQRPRNEPLGALSVLLGPGATWDHPFLKERLLPSLLPCKPEASSLPHFMLKEHCHLPRRQCLHISSAWSQVVKGCVDPKPMVCWNADLPCRLSSACRQEGQ